MSEKSRNNSVVATHSARRHAFCRCVNRRRVDLDALGRRRIAAAKHWVDPIAERLQPLFRAAVRPKAVRNALDGVWLGAPLHPPLTDVPVGSWTAAPSRSASSQPCPPQ